ncbi:MAG: hypothetical protein PVH87_08010 [Desulfobacteraceae bacterium]|jgi:hypothetical protein
MMKSIRFIPALMVVLTFGATMAAVYVNDILTFTNDTDEKLNVELSISGSAGWHTYDLYVLPGHTSIADFWADSFNAAYSACAYGDITDDFYGCIEGSVGDDDNNVYFGNGNEPYLSTPSGLPADWFVFDNPYDNAYARDEKDETDTSFFFHAECFIGSTFNTYREYTMNRNLFHSSHME